MNASIFRIASMDVKPHIIEKIGFSKLDLISMLETIILRGKPLGFEPDKLPDRQWILNVGSIE
jgi:hypothetical protein